MKITTPMVRTIMLEVTDEELAFLYVLIGSVGGNVDDPTTGMWNTLRSYYGNHSSYDVLKRLGYALVAPVAPIEFRKL